MMTKSVALGVLLFVAGVAVGRVSVLMTQPEAPAPGSTPSGMANTALPPNHPPMPSSPSAPMAMGGAQNANIIRGQVAEVIQVSQYTYLRLESGEWAAIPSTPTLTAGQTVAVVGQTQMTDFASPSLGRTFPKIWFGALEGAAPQPRANDDLPAQPMPPPAAPEVKKALQAVESSGALTLRVVDVYSERKALVGQRVKVKGTVDRVSLVQGVTYVHLKDGTGTAGDKTDDLLCLSSGDVAKGASVTMEGTIALEKDIGMGPVPVVLDQATSK